MLKKSLKISIECFEEVNKVLTNENNPLVQNLWETVEHYGGIAKINKEADEAGNLLNLLDSAKRKNPRYFNDLCKLSIWVENKNFLSIKEYREKILGGDYKKIFDEKNAVTLEISALQYFPWLMAEAQTALCSGELMPGRFIRVRKMKEQEKDGDLLAICAAMKILDASWVETLDTKGTDGSNVHLDMKNPTSTLTGFFGGIGQPNEYALKWANELLYYHINYGIKEVLNFNLGTILAALWFYKWGIDIGFKISVFAGIDNPFAALVILTMAKLFSRQDGTTPLKGFNLSNSVSAGTVRHIAWCRKELGLEDEVRIEHHIIEAYTGIVRQPYDRTYDLLKLAEDVPNISAKHEGAGPEIDSKRERPSSIFDYFREKREIEKSGEMHLLEDSYLDKHDAVQRTAEELTKAGIAVVCAGAHSRE